MAVVKTNRLLKTRCPSLVIPSLSHIFLTNGYRIDWLHIFPYLKK